MSSRDATPSSRAVLRRKTELVDRVQVPGVGDGDPQDVILELVRDRNRPLERLHRDQLDRIDGDTDGREVDDGKVMAHGEHARDSVRGCDALVDQCLRQRGPVDSTATYEGERIGGNERRVLEQVEEELGRIVGAEWRRQRTARRNGVSSGLSWLLGTRCASDAHRLLPRRGYRQRLSAP